MSWPYRNYSTYLGRWYQQEKLGMIPNDTINEFSPKRQYIDGMNLFEPFESNPIINLDTSGLLSLDCPDGGCPSGWLDPLPSSGTNVDWHYWNAFIQYVFKLGDVEFRHTSVFAQRLANNPGINPSWKPLRKKIIDKSKSKCKNLQPCKCTSFSFDGISPEGYSYNNTNDLAWTINTGNNDAYSTLKHRVRCCIGKKCNEATVVCRVRFDLRDTYSFDFGINPPFMKKIGLKFDHIVHFDKTLEETISCD